MPSRQIFTGRPIRIILCCLSLLTAGGGTGPALAQDRLVTGFRPIPPYVIAGADGALSGLEYELVTVAARRGGLALKPELAPMGRLPEDFRRGALDAFAPASATMDLPGCLSDTVLVYRNVAFSLAQHGLILREIADLANHDVTAFQNAHVMLGPEMMAVRQGNPKYREVANQMLQVRALFSGRTDVAIAERRIFRYLMQGGDVGLDTSAPLAEHMLFPPTSYGVAFQKAEQCIAFNRGLDAIRQSGEFEAIFRRWDGDRQARGGGSPGGRPPG